jgi:predicted 2-oxoglutarate/Fe(II)-dependent dioxygenase YbiX
MNEGAFNPLHSDTTNLDGTPLQPDGTPEELEWSGLLYLNNNGEDFEGGTIYFPKQDVEILPKAGDLVLFPGDVHHVHEVPEVTKGKRKNLVFFYGREGVVGSDKNFFDLENFTPENYEKYGKTIQNPI